MAGEKDSDIYLGREVRIQGMYLLSSNHMTFRLLLIEPNEAAAPVLTGPRCQGSVV
jgi:hypothetical protein